MTLNLFVRGVPAPQGSMKIQRGRVVPDNAKTKPWREMLGMEMRAAWGAKPPLDEAVRVTAIFMFPRNAGHVHKDGTVKVSAPTHKATKPDLDKLQRAVGDALSDAGIVRDDGRIVAWHASKIYSDVPGVSIMVQRVNG